MSRTKMVHGLVMGSLLLLAACGAPGAPNTPRPVPTVGNEVVAAELATVVTPTFDTQAAKDEAGLTVAALPLDLDKYRPAPLPEHVEEAQLDRAHVATPAGRAVSFDLATKQQRLEGLPSLETASVKTSDEQPGGEGAAKFGFDSEESGLLPQNFGGLSYISNPTASPYSKHVKVFMTRRNWNGSAYDTSNWVCSGTLIDPEWVLTAGHCVFDRSNGGWNYATTVVPGYKDGAQPWGGATAAQLYSWTGWTSDRDYDHDIGLVRLSRPIGAVAGWQGYGYSNDCDYFTRNTWTNPGYPAASPYSGKYLYDSTGDFDSCDTLFGGWYGNEVKFNRLSYGGQSGSGAVKSGVVRAVLSNGNNSNTWDVRLTSGKYGDAKTWIDDNTPAGFDLHALDANAAPSTITAGNRLSTLDYLLHNYSKASSSGRYTATVYLSTNDTISSYDTPISSHYLDWSFSPKSSVRVNAALPYIPTCTRSGDYYIGVILTTRDGNTSNNATMGADAVPVHVNASSSCR